MIVENRQSVTERLGPLGNMVIDLASQLQFPIQNPPQLARSFRPDQHLLVGAARYPLPQLALQTPEELFPIESFEDLTEKLERLQLSRLQPAEIGALLEGQPLIGFTVRRDEELVRRQAERSFSQAGGPETPPAPMRKPPIEADPDPDRTRLIEALGPLGGMVLDIAGRVTFPVRDQVELARQFTEDERIIINADAYPLPRLALQVPDELFPIESQDDLVSKLDRGGIKEVGPDQLRSLLKGTDQVGLIVKYSEEEVQRRLERFGTEAMKTGEPENLPRSADESALVLEDPYPEHTKLASRLGPLGAMFMDLADQVIFPVKDPIALARNFTDEEVLFVGPRQYPLGQLALRMPEEIFPLTSIDDLVEKLERLGAQELDVERLGDLIAEDPAIGYSNPYKEEELRKMAGQFEMELGGPETSPPSIRDHG